MVLGSVDKYLPLIYTPAATIFDYVPGIVVFSEYSAVSDRMRSVMAQYAEDYRILLEAGTLCKGLDGYYMEPAAFFALAQERVCFYLNTFMQGGDRIDYRRILNIEALQTAPWGGEIRQLIEDLDGFCKMGYRTMLVAGSEKTLPILLADLTESGIPCALAKPDSVCQPGEVLLMEGSLSGGASYPENKTAILTQGKAVTARHKKRKVKKGEEIRRIPVHFQ